MQGTVVDTAVGLPYLNVKLAPAPYCLHPLFVAAGSQSSCYVPRLYSFGLGIEVAVAQTAPSGSGGHSPQHHAHGHGQPSPVSRHCKVFQRCVVVSYAHILVLDGPAATASILSATVDGDSTFRQVGLIHSIPISGGDKEESASPSDESKLMGLVLSEEDPTWITLLRDSGRQDVVIQLPVQIEATTFLKSLSALYQHHLGRDLPVTVVDSTDELRHRALMSTKNTRFVENGGCDNNMASEGRSGVNRLIPRQLWSVSNLDVPFVHDRMGFVKDTFAAVEKETKADLAELERNMHSAMRKIDLKLDHQKSKTDEFERLQRAQSERELSIQAEQQELAQTLQQVQETEQKHDRLRMSFVEETQSWRDVFQQRLSEELKKRQRLAHLQERRANCAEQGKKELQALEDKIGLFTCRIDQYESSDYVSLVQERDHVMNTVKSLTAELSSLKKETGFLSAGEAGSAGSAGAAASPSSSRSASRRSRSAATSALTTSSIADRGFDAEALSTNAKLRQLLEQCRIEMAEQEQHQHELQEDLRGFSEECSALQEEELLFECRQKQQQAKVQSLLAAATATDQLISKQRELIAELKAMPRFYIERQRLKAAVSRRSALEEEVDKAKAAQVAALNGLQQEVFAEKIRVIGLVQQQNGQVEES